MAGGWKRKKWVFEMFGVRQQKSEKPILHLLHRRSRRHLVPLVAHLVRPESSIISDEWRAYCILPALGYNHHNDNHSRWYVDPKLVPIPNILRGPGDPIRSRSGGLGEIGQRVCFLTTLQ
ncbi:hypothetical protein QQF64_033959 [Cirrhinus molitorella]|uniref:ISXO2-like transposase domain-containing protein n=1 Tax=Cirrhinus molitorella TaxID=172907 RepID=A0ABR3MVH2_9TELE